MFDLPSDPEVYPSTKVGRVPSPLDGHGEGQIKTWKVVLFWVIVSPLCLYLSLLALTTFGLYTP